MKKIMQYETKCAFSRNKLLTIKVYYQKKRLNKRAFLFYCLSCFSTDKLPDLVHTWIVPGPISSLRLNLRWVGYFKAWWILWILSSSNFNNNLVFYLIETFKTNIFFLMKYETNCTVMTLKYIQVYTRFHKSLCHLKRWC